MCRVNCRQFCEEWRMWIRPGLIISYVVFAIIVVPLLIVNSVKDGFQRGDQLILIGGLFVLSAVPISIWHIIQHMIHFTKPILQKHIIRILWMVPIYATNAVSHANFGSKNKFNSFSLISVDWITFPNTFDLCRFIAWMLRSIRYLQLHGLFT